MSATTGAADGTGWNLWSLCTLSTTHEFDGTGATLVVRARGQFAGGQWPAMTVRVGGEVVGAVNVASSAYTPYEFELSTPAAAREVSIAFDNDYYERRG